MFNTFARAASRARMLWAAVRQNRRNENSVLLSASSHKPTGQGRSFSFAHATAGVPSSRSARSARSRFSRALSTLTVFATATATVFAAQVINPSTPAQAREYTNDCSPRTSDPFSSEHILRFTRSMSCSEGIYIRSGFFSVSGISQRIILDPGVRVDVAGHGITPYHSVGQNSPLTIGVSAGAHLNVRNDYDGALSGIKAD